MAAVSEVTWRVIPLHTPRIARHCPRCGADRPFSSSDRFRVNANARKLDVWLIYRCEACDSTFNLTVHTRVSPAKLGPDLDRYQVNDPDAAWDVAFDGRSVRGAGRVEPVAFRVEGPPAADPFVACLAFDRRFDVAVDRIVAVAMGLPRSRLPRELRRAALPGMRIRVDQGVLSVVPPPPPM